ncbi:hypothetical protein ACQR0Z_19270 [Bradyrhizobium sp. HKCCYLS3077]
MPFAMGALRWSETITVAISALGTEVESSSLLVIGSFCHRFVRCTSDIAPAIIDGSEPTDAHSTVLLPAEHVKLHRDTMMNSALHPRRCCRATLPENPGFHPMTSDLRRLHAVDREPAWIVAGEDERLRSNG